MTEEYIKYLATLCEGRNLLKEHEHYYDPETGMSYDDEGNSWRGAPNPKYDVSGYWPHSGHSSWWRGGDSKYSRSSKSSSTPKVIDKDKLYFGRPANTESALVYFLLQACGLYIGKYILPNGVEKRSAKEIASNIVALASKLCHRDFTEFKSPHYSMAAREQLKELFKACGTYFGQDKNKRDASDVKSQLDTMLK